MFYAGFNRHGAETSYRDRHWWFYAFKTRRERDLFITANNAASGKYIACAITRDELRDWLGRDYTIADPYRDYTAQIVFASRREADWWLPRLPYLYDRSDEQEQDADAKLFYPIFQLNSNG